MTEPTVDNRKSPTPDRRPRGPRSDSLADILERVLDSGVVVAGDIRVQLADIELLTIQLRLIVCSVERAEELGMDWWRDADWLDGPDSEETAGSADGSEAPAVEPTPSSDEAAPAPDAGDGVAQRLERVERTLDRLEARLDEDDPGRRTDDPEPIEDSH